MAAIDVIIVTYCSPALAIRCLSSLEGATARHQVRPIVLDNASPDGTARILQREFPRVEVVARSDNSGFAAACNEGIARTDGDFVLLLNPDTELRPGVIDHLIEVLAADPEIGLISPRLEQIDGTFDHASKRNSPGPASALRYVAAKQFGVRADSDYLAPAVPERGFGFVDAVNGAFMLSPRSLVEKVGHLDESYWMYGEDLEWCRRFRQHGYRVAYDGRVTAIHLKGGSSGRYRSPKVNWHFHRSMWLYYRGEDSYASPVWRLVVFGGIALHWLLTTTRWAVSKIS